ncbi:pilus assembly protein TadG-related protein [Actinoplanes sp. CA-252034]|uniref:pilus assembly protein TadG-related protein n=1 Tax=Actinoplanes sp. CA-252034 TaxID=3239906 RepID=UPI003D969F06
MRREGDEGAVAIIAAMMSAVLIFGIGAVVIDVGLLYAEKEQLQSGADFASWKVAQACIADPAVCTSAGQAANARTYAEKNAKDTRADAQVCVNNQNCPVWGTAATCPPQPAITGNYDTAEVRTSTRTTDNTRLVPPIFAQALTGGAYQGKQVGACARVVWGVPIATNALAMGVSKCDWDRMTNGGTKFYALPGLDPLLQQTGLYSMLGLQPPVDNAIAINNPLLSWCKNPLDLTSSSGYAWLSALGDCHLNVTTSTTGLQNWVTAPALNLLSAITCTGELAEARASGQPVLVPIFDSTVGATNILPAAYRIVGFAPFVVTGYTTLLGTLANVPSILTNTVPGLASTLCGLQRCVYGYFTKSIIPKHMPTQFGTTRNFGLTVIGRTG